MSDDDESLDEGCIAGRDVDALQLWLVGEREAGVPLGSGARYAAALPLPAAAVAPAHRALLLVPPAQDALLVATVEQVS